MWSNKTMPAEYAVPEEKPRRTLIIVVAVIAAVVIGGFFYLLFRGMTSSDQPRQVENAIRPGSPEWDQYSRKIVLDKPEASQATNVLGGFQMTLETTVRNFTGRTIEALELRAAVLDSTGKVLRERTAVVIPGKRPELDPNKTVFVTVTLDGMKESDDRASLWMEVAAFRLK